MSSKGAFDNLRTRPMGLITNSAYDTNTVYENTFVDCLDNFLTIYYILIFIMGCMTYFLMEPTCCDSCVLATTSLVFFLILGIVDFLKPILSMSLVCMCLPCIISLLGNSTFWNWIMGNEYDEEYRIGNYFFLHKKMKWG